MYSILSTVVKRASARPACRSTDPGRRAADGHLTAPRYGVIKYERSNVERRFVEALDVVEKRYPFLRENGSHVCGTVVL